MAVLRAAGTPDQVISHCRAVCEEALRPADRLPAGEAAPDRPLLYAAALLHDVARTESRHAETGAAWIRALGYPEVAGVIARHHDFGGDSLDEAALLFLADKYVRGTERVSLEERFAASAGRCTDEEARAAHERRFQTAKRLEKRIISG